MTTHIEPRRVAAELRCILVDPGDGAAYLLRHYAKIAACLLDRDEIDRNVMRTCVDEHLSRIAVILRCAAQPRAAVDKNENRRVLPFRAIDIEPLSRGGPVGFALRRTNSGAHCLAV